MQEELREAGGKGGLEHLGKDMQKGEKRLDGETGQGNTCTEVERSK